MSEGTLTAGQLAEYCETDAKTFRRFVRKMQGGTIGVGNRYAFKASEADAIKALFDEWRKGRGQRVMITFVDES